MTSYIHLFKMTGEGIKDIRQAPDRVEKGIQKIEEMGGKMIALYATMGEWDYVGITEWPDDEAAAAFLLSWGSTGVVRTTTLKAFTMEQYRGIIARIS